MHKSVFPRRLVLIALALALLPTITTAAATDSQHGSVAFVEVKYGNMSTYQASAVEVSADGKFLYLGLAGGSITVFSRDSSDGSLFLVEFINDPGGGGSIGLFGLGDIVISPDGKHLYTCSGSDDAITVFIRNTITGQLTYYGMLKDGVSANFLDGAQSLAISPDGTYVYAASVDDSAIPRFSRNSTTGALTPVGAIIDGLGLAQDLGGVFGLTISPDGKHLYAAANDDDALTTFSRDVSTGQLSYVEREKDGEAGVDGLNGARSVDVSPDGNHVYVSAWADDSVATFSRNSTSGALTYIEVDKDGVNGVDGLDAASDVVVSPDNAHVYVSSYGDDSIVVFSRNASSGRLTYLQRVVDNTGYADGLEGALQMAISPDGGYAYVATRNEGALAILRRDAGTGNLQYVHTVEDMHYADGPVGVAVSPDGKNLYVASNVNSKLSVLSRNPLTGKVRRLEGFRDNVDGVNGLQGARAVAVSPDGKHVYVAGHGDSGIARFSRNSTSGTLIYGGVVLNSDPGVSGLGGIQSLAVSPTGAYVYAVSTGDDALVVLTRDTSTGALTYLKHFLDATPGIDGLNDAYAVATSSGGGHVYVAGYADNSVAHFKWEKPAGLGFQSVIKDGVGGVDGLWGANSIAISPDGTRLYVASRNDDAIAVFRRSTTTGDLTYDSCVRNTVSGVDGLDGARAITMNPSGTYVYVASQVDDALAVFSRDTTSGDLAYFASTKDTDPGIDGLDTANGIAISPASNHIYVASYGDDAVSVFVHHWQIYLPMVVRNGS